MHMERSVFHFHELHKSSRMMVVLTRWRENRARQNSDRVKRRKEVPPSVSLLVISEALSFPFIALSFWMSSFSDCCLTSGQHLCCIKKVERKGVKRWEMEELEAGVGQIGGGGSWETEFKCTAFYYLLVILTKME